MIKNLLHFGKVRSVTAKEANKPEDSGNGYYSYSYYILPFSGKIVDGAFGRIVSILHKRYYSYPFNSLGDVSILNTTDTGGEILFCVTYHHGD